MTDAELRDQAIAYLKKTTISYPEYVRRSGDPSYDVKATNWWKALNALAQIPKA